MRVSLCFVPTMPNVGSRYSQFSFEKKKKQLHLVLKKVKTAEVGFLGSISQTGRIVSMIYERWTTGAGFVGGTQTFRW